MKVPLSWIKEYVELDGGLSIDDLARELTHIGLPVESVTYTAPEVTGVIAGKILKIREHPNADKLVLCDVDLGEKVLQIVTGAKNVREGHTVPVALDGAQLHGGLKIKHSKIRGEESNGMMCSAKELNLDIKDLPVEQREGVMILPPDTQPGADIISLYCLHDPVFEFETFANRPDQLSVLGVAGEVAAIFGKPLKTPDMDYPTIQEKASDMVTMEILDKELCPKYSGRVIRDMKIEKSPLWMQGRLYAAGMRSINNVVDITNYVMIETGQPLHAFDLVKVKGGKIIVRPAKEGETLVTLDGVERKLDPDVLVIADESGPVALAGVMGGLDSEVGDKTRDILLEAANFNAPSIRRTSIRLNLPSESSRRFEKGIDYHRADLGSRRACHFMAKMGGKILEGEAVDGIEPPKPLELKLRPNRVNHILGTDLTRETIGDLLNRLDFSVKDQGEEFLVTVPTVRKDITMETDLIEEVARIYGYDNIPTTDPIGVSMGGQEPDTEFDEQLRDILTGCGLFEAITLSLYNEKVPEDYRIESDSLLRVMNPVTEEQKLLRHDAIPHLIDMVKRNIANRRFNFKLFEVSKFYSDTGEEEPRERRDAVILLSSPEPGAEYDFFALKGMVEHTAKTLNIPVVFEKGTLPCLHPGKSAKIMSGEHTLGFIGEFHPEIAREQDLSQPVVLAKLSVDTLRELQKTTAFRELPRFPAMERDMAVLIDDSVSAGDVESIIRDKGKPILVDSYCFDVYKGKQVPDDKKSLAFRLAFEAPDRTLTDQEVQKKMDRILKTLEIKLGAQLRG